MLIAVTADRPGTGGAVPPRYEQSAVLLVWETDTDTVVAHYPKTDEDGRGFGGHINRHRCEAVACGDMAAPGFEALAAAGVTRYRAAGLGVRAAVRGALENALPLITDFQGGSGCAAHSPGGCGRHGEDREEGSESGWERP